MSEAAPAKEEIATEHTRRRFNLQRLGYGLIAAASFTTAAILAGPRVWEEIEQSQSLCGTTEMTAGGSEHRIYSQDEPVGWSTIERDELRVRDHDSFFGDYTYNHPVENLPSTIELQGVNFTVNSTVDETGKVVSAKLACIDD